MEKRIPRILDRTQFGNPILNESAKRLSSKEIQSKQIQALISDIQYTLDSRSYGVGLAAPQVGVSVAISVIDIRPSKTARSTEPYTQIIINPEVIEGEGKKVAMWEGCLSFGSKNSPVFAQAMRYQKIKVTYYDENAKRHTKILEGLPAHVFQHETDHLNGILFPQRVKDHTTWMNFIEYKNLIKSKRKTDKQ